MRTLARTQPVPKSSMAVPLVAKITKIPNAKRATEITARTSRMGF